MFRVSTLLFEREASPDDHAGIPVRLGIVGMSMNIVRAAIGQVPAGVKP